MSVSASPVRRCLAGMLALGTALVVCVGITVGVAGADRRDDQQFVNQAVLVAADVPPGYQQQPTLKPGPPEGRVCAGMRAAVQRQEKVPNAATFYKGADTGTVIDLVSLLPNDTAATKVVDAYTTPRAGKCLQRELRAAFTPAKERDETLEVTVDVQPATPGVGDQSTGWHVTVSLENKDGMLQNVVDLTVVRVGRAVARFDFGAPATGVPFQPQMVQAVLDRLGAQP